MYRSYCLQLWRVVLKRWLCLPIVCLLYSCLDEKVFLFISDTVDCHDCNDYKLLPHESLRSTAHETDTSGDYLCDRDLEEDWYRAVTGGDIATEAPGWLHCGTLFTVWYNGKCYKGRVQTPWPYIFDRLYLSPGKVGANAACSYWSNLGSVHQVPITAGWTEAVWNTKFARHFYTWPALGMEPQTF